MKKKIAGKKKIELELLTKIYSLIYTLWKGIKPMNSNFFPFLPANRKSRFVVAFR